MWRALIQLVFVSCNQHRQLKIHTIRSSRRAVPLFEHGRSFCRTSHDEKLSSTVLLCASSKPQPWSSKVDAEEAIHSAMKYQPKKTSPGEGGGWFRVCMHLICKSLKAEQHNSPGQLSNKSVNVQLSPRHPTGFGGTLSTDFCGLMVKRPLGLIKCSSLHKETVHETLMALGTAVSAVDERWIILNETVNSTHYYSFAGLTGFFYGDQVGLKSISIQDRKSVV